MAGRFNGIAIYPLKARSQFVCLALPREYCSEQPVKVDIVERTERVRHNDVGNKLCRRLDTFPRILVHIDDQMRRLESANFVQVKILGATNFGYRFDRRFRVKTESGAPYNLATKTKIEQQFGNAGDEADDACVFTRRRVTCSGRIDYF